MTDQQLRHRGGESWSWAARVYGASAYDLAGTKITANLRDAAGRFITDSTATVRLQRRTNGWVGGTITVEGSEVPASVHVTAAGHPATPSRVRLRIVDARPVVVTSEYSDTSVAVRGSIRNEASEAAEFDYVFVTVFDAAGRLVAAEQDYAFARLPASGEVGVDVDAGTLDGAVPVRAEVFTPLDD